MEIKLFELRDRSTCIPLMAILMESSVPRERALLRGSGYGEGTNLVVITPMKGGQSSYDPYKWGGRTYGTAHQYVVDNWNELQSGALIDVRVILGEAAEPCMTDLSA